MRQKREASNKNSTKGLDEGQGKSDRRRSRSRERGQDKTRAEDRSKTRAAERKQAKSPSRKGRSSLFLSDQREKRI